MAFKRKKLADTLEKNLTHIYQAKLRAEPALATLLECLEDEPNGLVFPCNGSRLLLTAGAGVNDCPPVSIPMHTS
jgi:hypothetical protein